jgi:outer membrane protein OmpA-like peptidoglycan-associated protein
MKQKIYFFIIILICFCNNTIKAQNYFANADFEALNNCKELHQDCASEAWFYLKPAVTPLIYSNIVPQPFSGKDLLILPVENVFKKVITHAYVYTMFCCPLQKGKNYKLSFYIHTGEHKFLGLDFLFTPNEYVSNNFYPDSVKPSIHVTNEDVKMENQTWKYIEIKYTATGDEKFCLLGNLSKKSFAYNDQVRMNKAGDIFYFIDNISFTPVIPEKICTQFNKNVEKLYAQNLRHTENALVDSIPVVITDTIIIPAIYFETDKAILKSIFKKTLTQLIAKYAGKTITHIDVEGHTDNTGTEERNIILSKERADAVQNYFILKMPMVKNNIFAIGKSANFPIASNNDEKGRAKNRRVQILLSYYNTKNSR